MHTPTTPSPLRRPGGFTLIELLTVIAVIGILAAILLPVIGKVRQSARRAQGISNLRQITMAGTLVANDNRGMWFWDANHLVRNGSTRYYMAAISDFLRGAGTTGASSAIFTDPIAPAGSFNNFAVNPIFFGSYASQHPARAPYNRLQNVRTPSRAIFFGDQAGTYSELQNIGRNGSIWSWLWSSPSASLGAWTHDQLPATYGGSGGQFDFVRDPGGTKVGFLDGSVRRLKASEISHAMVDPACN